MGVTGDQHPAYIDLITETSFLKIWRKLLIEIYDPEYRITDKKIIFDFINVRGLISKHQQVFTIKMSTLISANITLRAKIL